MKLKNIMKNRITMYLAIAILAIGLSQCKKEEDPNPPTISVISPTDADPIAFPGEFIQLSVKVTADAENGAELSSIVVKQKFEDEAAQLPVDDPISGSEYTLEKTIQIADEEGTEVWTITVTDNQGQQTVKTITITISGDAPNLKPTLVFAGPPAQNTDFTTDINTAFTIGIIANSNTDSGAELSKLLVTKKVGDLNPEPVFPERDISGIVFTWDTVFFSNYQPAVEKYTFRITDVHGQIVEKSITVTTEQEDVGIFIFEGKQLGSYESGVNAGFSTRISSGMSFDVFTVPVEEEADVDFIFFHDAGFGLSLMSPEYDYLIGMYPPVNNWETRNKTMFQKTTLTTEQYNGIENKNQLVLMMQNYAGIGEFVVSYYSSVISQPGGFEVNDIFAFQNPIGLQGLMIIKEIDEGASPGQTKIIFDMKVDKP